MLKKLVHTHLQQELSRICRSYVRIFTATIYPIVLQQLLLPGLVRVGGLFQGWRDMLGFTHLSSTKCTIHLPLIFHRKKYYDMSNCIYLLWWKEDVASSRVWGNVGFTCKNGIKTRWGKSKNEIGFDVHHIYEHIDVKDWKTRPIMVEKCQNLRNEIKTRWGDSVNLLYWGHRTKKSRSSSIQYIYIYTYIQYTFCTFASTVFFSEFVDEPEF